MKKLLSVIAALFVCSFLQAQVKVHNDGQISLQTVSNSWYNGVQIYPNGVTYFNTTQTNPWHWVTIATPKDPKGKCWIVAAESNKLDHKFFVTGEGYTYKRGSYKLSDSSLQSGNVPINNADAILDNITGTYYIPIDETESGDGSKESNRRVGISSKDIEKLLPEAVTSDENGLQYVDYDALTVILIEAYKEQQKEIEMLKKTLEEHGLLKPQK